MKIIFDLKEVTQKYPANRSTVRRGSLAYDHVLGQLSTLFSSPVDSGELSFEMASLDYETMGIDSVTGTDNLYYYAVKGIKEAIGGHTVTGVSELDCGKLELTMRTLE